MVKDLLRKVRYVIDETDGSHQDLLLHQQDLDRQQKAFSIVLESHNRVIQSQIEFNRLVYKFMNEINDNLLSKKQDSIGIEYGKEKYVIDEANSSTTTEEEESDGDAAKILIDLSAQEETARATQGGETALHSLQETQAVVGCRFNPTDQELIGLLKDKIAGKSIPMYIRERNLYGNDDPATIFGANPASELYFVTQIKKKFDSGKKNSRIVGNGTWKIQNNKNVYEDPTNKKKVIGEKRALNFVDENTKKDKISWIMHEYKLCSAAENPDRWVICRIKRGKGNRIGLDSQPSSKTNANDDEEVRIVNDENVDDLSLPEKRGILETATVEDTKNASNNEDASLPEKRRVLETANVEGTKNASNDDELRQPKKRRMLETLDLSLSLGLPSGKTVAPNVIEHSRRSPPWDTFI